jgi:hypothetical protein
MSKLAKAVSGFGNSQGGVIIYGIENKNKTLIPFCGYEKFEVLVQESLSRATNPNHCEVETTRISSSGAPKKGYVVVKINQSTNRPLQVVTSKYTHRYFYRSGETHADMPHDVIMGMLGSSITPQLIYQFNTADEVEEIFLEIILRNKSSVIARDVWFNLDVGFPSVEVNFTSSSYNNFTGARLQNTVSLISVENFRLPPQGIIAPTELKIPKNKLSKDGQHHFYFSYGCTGEGVKEFDAKFTGAEFNSVENLSGETFINFLKEKDKNVVS